MTWITGPANDADEVDGPAPQVMAALVAGHVSYRVIDHGQLGIAVRSPADVAGALAMDLARLAKTLFVVQVPERESFALTLLPVTARLQFSTVATERNWRRAALASDDELASHVGQPAFGVSPLGIPDLPVLMDAALMSHPTILVGGGRPGIEIEIDPESVTALTAAKVLDLSARPTEYRE